MIAAIVFAPLAVLALAAVCTLADMARWLYLNRKKKG